MKQFLYKILSRNRTVKKAAKAVWDFWRMHVFEIVYLHTYNPELNLKRIYLFGKVINLPSFLIDNKRHIFYFKINREDEYSLMCIQHWINSINRLDEDYICYFVCDNKNLERKIARFICFKDDQIVFIPSMHKKIKKAAENIYTSYWKNATYAHLTPFYHAKQHGYQYYWAIDGDDTMFCTDPENVAKMIEEVESLVKKKDYTAISLDMWRSRTHGKHWSLGVVFINDNNDLCHYFEENQDNTWIDHYKEWDNAFNVDWFFNYLKDYKNVKIESFYVDKCYFIHWGDFFRNLIGSSICYWNDCHIIYPIFKWILRNDDLGDLLISDDVIKVDLELNLSDGLSFFENEISLVRFFSPELRKLHHLNDFGSKTKYYY